jgi:hypothetical protein
MVDDCDNYFHLNIIFIDGTIFILIKLCFIVSEFTTDQMRDAEDFANSAIV